jgi:flagellar basal-body rod protein FlgG
MDRGLYIAASGMLAEQTRQDQIANDLANASTPGYKADRSAQQSFGRILLENTATGQSVGPLGLGAAITRTVTNLAPAALKETDEPLDLALDGDGFFAVQTTAGTRYTRDGQCVVDAAGVLRTSTGYAVLDTTGRPLQVGSSNGLTIAPDGTVTRAGRTLGQIGVVSLTGPVKQGDAVRRRSRRQAGRNGGPPGLPGVVRRRCDDRDGRADDVAAHVRVGPEGDPDDRRDAPEGRRVRRALKTGDDRTITGADRQEGPRPDCIAEAAGRSPKSASQPLQANRG